MGPSRKLAGAIQLTIELFRKRFEETAGVPRNEIGSNRGLRGKWGATTVEILLNIFDVTGNSIRSFQNLGFYRPADSPVA